MAYVDLNSVQDPTTGERILANWGDRVRDNQEDHEARIVTAETHADRTDNPHNVTQAQVGLDQVDNTADLQKPVSVFQQDALDLKADQAALDLKADKSEILGPIWIPASQFTPLLPDTSAIPVLEKVGYRMMMKIGETTGWIGIQRVLPAEWNTYNVNLYWTRTGAEAAGDVRLQWATASLAESGDVTTTPTGSGSDSIRTESAPAQNQRKTTELAVTQAVGTDDLKALTVVRHGFSGADTFTGAIHIMAVELVRAT